MNNTRYLYQVGDRVVHDHHTFIQGTIVELLTMNEESGEPLNKLDVTNPWYRIQWDNETGFVGFEHEYSLLPGTCNPTPSEFIQRVHEQDKELWDKIVEEIRDDYPR